MRILDNLKFIGTDERVRKFLLPTRIVSAAGTVQHAENLLVQKPLQIGLAEKEYTILENGDDGSTRRSCWISAQNCMAAYG